MRLVKRLVLSVLVVVALAIVAVVIIVSTTDFNEYKSTIAAQLKAATGREVTIGGRIETRLLSAKPAIVVNDITIANAPWGTRKEMVRLKRLEVKVALLPLIVGDIAVKRMVAIEPDILLETDKSGRQNWVFAATSAKQATSGSGPNLSFKQLRIEGARIAYRDGSSGAIDRFGIKRLTATAKSLTSPMRFVAVGSVDERAVSIMGQIGPLADLFSGRAVNVQFAATAGKSDIEGKIVLQLADKVSLKGTVESKRLDFRDFGETAKDPRLFGAGPMPVGLLRAINANLGFTANRLMAGSTPLIDAKATIRVADGVLTASKLSAGLAGGVLSGELSVNAAARPAKFKTKFSLTRVSLAKLTPSVAGPMRLHVDVRGVGDTPRAIASSLSGRSWLVGGPGRVANDGLVLLTFGIGSLQKLLTRGSVNAENVNCVVARFDFTAGIGRSRVLVIDSNRLTFLGRGNVNLRSEQMNLLFVPRTKETGLGDVTLHPVRLAGPIRRPSATVDASAAANEVAKNIYGSARRSINWVGSLIGASSRGKKRGSPCPGAIAAATGRGTVVRPGRPGKPARRQPAKPSRKKNLLQRLNPFD